MLLTSPDASRAEMKNHSENFSMALKIPVLQSFIMSLVERHPYSFQLHSCTTQPELEYISQLELNRTGSQLVKSDLGLHSTGSLNGPCLVSAHRAILFCLGKNFRRIN